MLEIFHFLYSGKLKKKNTLAQNSNKLAAWLKIPDAMGACQCPPAWFSDRACSKRTQLTPVEHWISIKLGFCT